MNAFLYGIGLQWKLNARSKEILVHYYLVPLIFYVFIGGIFTAIDPESSDTIIQSMTVFGITMGGVLGSPYPLVEFYGSDMKKSYQVGGIPVWTAAAGNFISGVLHLFLMSMVILITAPFMFDAAMPGYLPGYFLFLLLLITASLSVGMVFGLCLKSASKLGMATQLVFLPSIMLSGMMFPKSLLPQVLQNIGKIFPATWGFQGMCQSGVEMRDVLPLLIILFIGIAISSVRLKHA